RATLSRRSSLSSARTRKERKRKGSVPPGVPDGLDLKEAGLRHSDALGPVEARCRDARVRYEGDPEDLEGRVHAPDLVAAPHIAIRVEILRSRRAFPVHVAATAQGGEGRRPLPGL